MKIIRFCKKIKKIIEWLPVLWRDEDWDFEYMLDMLEYKLKRISNEIHKNNIIAKEAQREVFIGINQTLDHIKNYRNDTEAFKEIHGDFYIPIDYKHEKLPDGCYRMITINENTRLPLTEEEDEAYGKWLKESYIFQQREWDLIWDTIKKRGQGWWD